MKYGIHLPQYGRVASAQAIADAARHAEGLGFSDVWVSDHIGVPDGAPYPPAFLFDPLVSLSWAAAATRTIGLGTSVLVVPYRHPMVLAKQLASLDRLSDGRLIVGAAAGWLADEFAALGVPFDERGRRTDEGIAAIRACWENRIVDFESETVRIRKMRVEPRPERRIPIWIGGASPAAQRRAVRLGDGWHLIGTETEALASLIGQMRELRPDPEFTVSIRVTWDGLKGDRATYEREVEVLDAIGVQHIVAAPSQSDWPSWSASVEGLAEVFGLI